MLRGWVTKGERIKQKKKNPYICGTQTQQYGDSKRDKGVGEVEVGTGGTNGDRKRLDFGGEHMM